MARQQARRRNLERLAGVGLAVLGLVVLAVAIFAIRNPRTGTPAAAAPSSSASSPAAQTTSSAPRSSNRSLQPTDTVPITAGRSSRISLRQARQVPLVVLNNTTTNGLAAQAAQRFRSAGWTVTSIGNLANNIRSTCAYYAPSHPNAKAAAEALKREFPAIKRVRPRFPQLPVAPIVVVLAPDYALQ